VYVCLSLSLSLFLSFDTQIGNNRESWGYIAGNGKKCFNDGQGKSYGASYGSGDVVGECVYVCMYVCMYVCVVCVCCMCVSVREREKDNILSSLTQ